MNNLDLLKNITLVVYRKSAVEDKLKYGSIYANLKCDDFEHFRDTISSLIPVVDMMEYDSSKYEIRTEVTVNNKVFDVYLCDAVNKMIETFTR